jgi:Monooxygenase af470-like
MQTLDREERMNEIIASRVTARIEGDFVLFLIGMRINKPWKLHKWLPVARAMPKMLKELEAAPPEVGFLGHNGLSKTIVQYWRSFDHLERYARNRDALHWPAWVDFNRRMKETRGDVGIWHETYRVRAGEYESIYSGMPAYGLGKASARAAVTEEIDSARQRLGTA